MPTLAMVLMVALMPAMAGIYQCDHDGQTVFQDRPCEGSTPSITQNRPGEQQPKTAGLVLEISDKFGRDNSEKARNVTATELRNALNGSVQAQYNVGAFFLSGYGTEPDLKEAIYWFTKAAESGHVPAQLALGMIFSGSAGIEPDHQQALKWFEKAAQQQDATAEVALGKIYGLGLGVPRNYQRARVYLERAAKQGDPQAKEMLEEIGSELRVLATHEKAEREAGERKEARGFSVERFFQSSSDYWRAVVSTNRRRLVRCVVYDAKENPLNSAEQHIEPPVDEVIIPTTGASSRVERVSCFDAD